MSDQIDPNANNFNIPDDLNQDDFLVENNTIAYGTMAFFWEVLKIIAIALAIIIPVRYFLVQPFYVKGASMEETFQDGNYIMVNEFSYKFTTEPKRGDVVVFRYPNNTKEFFIKRIIGLPSETVEIKANRVVIYNREKPEGFVLDEREYLSPTQTTDGNIRIKLDPNEYYVLGDNRLQSSDSRTWGPVNRSYITGKVWIRAWPLNEIGTFDDPTYEISNI